MFNLVPPNEWIRTEQQLTEAVDYCWNACQRGGILGFDTETTGLSINKDLPLILSLSDGVRRFGFEFEHFGRHPLVVNGLLSNPDVRKVASNAKFDMHILANAGITVEGPVEDTVVQDWLFDENRFGHGLKETAKDYAGLKMKDFKEIFPMRKATAKVAGETAGDAIRRVMGDPQQRPLAEEYAGLDPYATVLVRNYLKAKLGAIKIRDGLSLWDHYDMWEVPFTRTLWNCERRGFCIETGHLKAQSGPMQAGMIELENEISSMAGWVVNVNSPMQLRKLLFVQVGHVPKKMTDGGKSGKKEPSTDEEVLTGLAENGCPYSQKIMEFRKISKTFGTYIEGMLQWVDHESRIYTTLNQAGTVTGRLSSREPNLQNIPRPKSDKYKIRDAFVAPIGRKLVVLDYDQLEMKLMAHFCLHKQMVVSTPTIGTSPTIGHIVNQQWDGKVSSYDWNTHKKVARKVTNHFRNSKPIKESSYRGGLKPKDWVVIRHEGAPWRKLIITKEHNVYTPNGKVPVANLEVGSLIFHEEPLLEGVSEQVLIGSLLGDGNFKRAKSSTGEGYFHSAAFYHGTAQTEYFDFKRRIMGPLVHSYRYDGKMNRAKVAASFQVEKLYDLMCENRKGRKAKRPTIHILDKLNLLGLAIWYMDDGGLGKDQRCSETKGFSANISNSRITEKEINYVNSKFGLDFNRWSRGMGLSGVRADKFFGLIAAFIPPCMDYKLPTHYRGKYDSKLWDTDIADITPVRIIEKRSGDSRKDPMGFGSGSKYDITVEGTHNYFAQGVLVSNSGDHEMLTAINSGKDLHCITVYRMYGVPYEEVFAAKKAKEPTYEQENLLLMRQSAKATGFGLIYGIGKNKLAVQLTEELKKPVTPDEAQALINKYFAAYPGVRQFIRGTHEYCKETEFVQTLVGRFRRLPGINSRGGKEDSDDGKGTAAEARRQSVNSIIQGTAADIAKGAMLRVDSDPELKALGAILLLQIHDELIIEIPDDDEIADKVLARAKVLMEDPFNGYKLAVPLTVGGSYGYCWSEAK